MFKVQTILCITLAVVAGKAAAQRDDSLDFLDGLPPPASGAKTPAPPAPLVGDSAVTAMTVPTDSPSSSWTDVESIFHNLIAERQKSLQRRYSAVVSQVKNAANAIDSAGASWQSEEQSNLLAEYKKINETYQRVLTTYPTKSFAKCDTILKKIADFLNLIGQDFYSCHVYYTKIARNWAHRIFPSMQPERDYLKGLSNFECGTSTISDAASERSAVECLIGVGMQLYQCPNANIAFTVIEESVNALVADQIRYFLSCPAYNKLRFYEQLKSGWLGSMRQCIQASVRS